MALPGVSSETRLVKIAFSPQAAFTALSILGSSAAGQENAIRPENFQPVMSANVDEKRGSSYGIKTCSFSMVDRCPRGGCNENKRSTARESERGAAGRAREEVKSKL